jgi:LacI family transcriptional regulator
MCLTFIFDFYIIKIGSAPNFKISQGNNGACWQKGEEGLTNLRLEDIARNCGVSRSTVSRVINNNPNVSEKVRRRVQKEINDTGFRPHAAARALVSQRSWTIGLVLPRSVQSFFTDPYYPRLIQGIAQGCNLMKYTLALYLLTDADDEEEIYPRLSRRGSLDGILFQSDQMGDQLIGKLANSDIPLVIIGRPFQNNNVSYIDIDNVSAAVSAVNYLVDLGYKKIGTITGPLNTTVGLDRKKGFINGLEGRGVSIEEGLIVEGDFTEENGYEGMKKLLPAKPDAVFVASDNMAIGAFRAIEDAGLKVPDDIAVVGFDDLPIPNPVISKLTTVKQPVYEFGIKAVELLDDLIAHGTNPPKNIIMGTELITRDSCGEKLKSRSH